MFRLVPEVCWVWLDRATTPNARAKLLRLSRWFRAPDRCPRCGRMSGDASDPKWLAGRARCCPNDDGGPCQRVLASYLARTSRNRFDGGRRYGWTDDGHGVDAHRDCGFFVCGEDNWSSRHRCPASSRRDRDRG